MKLFYALLVITGILLAIGFITSWPPVLILAGSMITLTTNRYLWCKDHP